MIKPAVGRIVWFRPSSDDLDDDIFGIVYNDKKQPSCAQICYVHNDRMVNISFVDQEGDTYSAQNVRLMHGDEAFNPGGSYCEWMPFQKGQAARVEPKTGVGEVAFLTVIARRLYESYAKEVGPFYLGQPKAWDQLSADEVLGWMEVAKASAA
jgi:hypothetical protein